MGKFPRKKEGFKCVICEEFYEEQEEADFCCYGEKTEIDSVMWQCVECRELHEDQEEAYRCCE